METSEALKSIKVLAEGINPFTVEMFPNDSPYQHPQMIRTLYRAVQVLQLEDKRERKKSGPENAGKPWNDNEDTMLASQFDSGLSIRQLADRHKRTEYAIQLRLVKLGKIDSSVVPLPRRSTRS